MIFPGAQCALGGFLTILTAPGDTVLTENITYPGIKGAAVRARVTLRGVATDADGILPDALDATCQKYMPKALYPVPTIHNPTTVTMPRSRRKDIAKVLARHRVVLLEDDAYGALEPDATPFVSLSPELAWHVSTISKCIAPGLRLAFAIAPDATGARALSEALRIDVQMTAPLMIALFTRWIRDGSADAIAAAIREEARARQTFGREILAGREFAAVPRPSISGCLCRRAGRPQSSSPMSAARDWPSSAAMPFISQVRHRMPCALPWAQPRAGAN